MELFKFGEILIPKSVDVKNWGVVACDQYTSQPEYWNTLREKTSDPTSLDLIFPECFLSMDNEPIIERINSKMNEYLNGGVFKSVNGTVLVERKTDHGTRWGLMALINLSEYSNDFTLKSLIRGTEGVVQSRIPPRVKIRKNAALELPHVMVLIDDKDRTVIEPLKGSGTVLYDGELNMGGGSITGYEISDVSGVTIALDKLLADSERKYGERLMFLVGDGNHSLATAKACMTDDNPLSGYALVEIVNIYDEGLKFEPIHRVVFGVDNEKFISGLKEALSGPEKIEIVCGDRTEQCAFPADSIEGVDRVQRYIDGYIAQNGGEVDYIHGYDSLKEVVDKTKGVGIALRGIDKNSFFSYVVKNGPMPRKTFSMGEAYEKRYYIEARKIK